MSQGPGASLSPVLGDYALAVIGLAVSAALLLLLAAKWKIPRRVAGLGGVGAALLAAISFLWLYPLCMSPGAAAAALLGQVALALALAGAGLMAAFWRDPERVPPTSGTRGVVLSAADGQVVYVKETGDDLPLVSKQGRDYRLEELAGTPFVHGPAWVIGVEMNFTNVHVNRCPIDGQVRLLKHIPGRFISLRKDEAPFVNERLTTVIDAPFLVADEHKGAIEGPHLSVVVVQVASRLVRRVESYLKVGQPVRAGQRLGMIRFGSLVAVVIPQRDDVRIAVQVGDRVTAGVSVLAHFDRG